ncbi:hypothetical protein BD410DRAFT_800479 [Rickenella mellea]|uniref:Uncharacterized protein n=1 Tax=Rickenella mellea TaxID=50990 RepID=A0A4Y7QG64_9AGAM|nr:hypothetical protein BD410DRAFT_800479 [Rickenella mellea]
MPRDAWGGLDRSTLSFVGSASIRRVCVNVPYTVEVVDSGQAWQDAAASRVVTDPEVPKMVFRRLPTDGDNDCKPSAKFAFTAQTNPWKSILCELRDLWQLQECLSVGCADRVLDGIGLRPFHAPPQLSAHLFDITLFGDWAQWAGPGTCKNAAADPNNFK